MKTEDLQAKGLTQEQIDFVMAENGKDLKKLQKENENLTADRDTWKEKAETAETTLKSFEGIDPDKIQSELREWQQKAADAEKNAQQQIYDRDFADALKAELEDVKFTSEAAKRDVMAQIKAAELKLKDGKILGLSDLIDQIKKADASAFVDEKQQELENNRARFTTAAKPGSGSHGTKKLSEMTLDERMKLKASDPELYESLRKGD